MHGLRWKISDDKIYLMLYHWSFAWGSIANKRKMFSWKGLLACVFDILVKQGSKMLDPMRNSSDTSYILCKFCLFVKEMWLISFWQGTFLPLVVPPTIFQAGLWSTWLAMLCFLKVLIARNGWTNVMFTLCIDLISCSLCRCFKL